ncbi:hypothetical protein CJF32_00005697 [Rutstroemia sp. NJR-2017a WRK4]|nr:hypothetical protein CJF32_00005697 [Rutstroemia sp. NJR-2017a WRK4]
MGNKNTRTTKSLTDLRTTGTTMAIPAKATKETESPLTAKTLSFKSYRQGTLITQNFEPVPTKSKPLCATSPEFIPAHLVKLGTSMTLSAGSQSAPKKVEPHCSIAPFPPAPVMKELQVQSHMAMPPANTRIGTAVSVFKPMERLTMNLPPGRPQQAIRRTIMTPFTRTIPHEPGFTPAHHRPRSTTAFARPTGLLPSPRPTHRRNQSLRVDRSQKDVVVSRHGIKHNILSATSNSTSYNFIDILRAMSGKQREEFWAKNWVEVVVDFDVKEGEHAAEEGKGKLEKYDVLIQNLELLGPEFKISVRNILINLLFPEPPPSSTPLTGPKPPPSPPGPASHDTPEFIHLTNIVRYFSTPELSLSSLQACTILLTVPNSSKPLSIPQLTLMLPFYDLPFTRWTINWRTSFMTRPEQVGGWPVHYLDRERDKLMREREKARREMEKVKRAGGNKNVNGGKKEDGGEKGKGGDHKGAEEGKGLMGDKGAEEEKVLQKGNDALVE